MPRGSKWGGILILEPSTTSQDRTKKRDGLYIVQGVYRGGSSSRLYVHRTNRRSFKRWTENNSCFNSGTAAGTKADEYHFWY